MPTCLVSLGANLGERQESLDAAVDRLRSHSAIGDLIQSARVETPAIGGPADQPAFLNSVARMETSIDPIGLLRFLQTLESDARRVRGDRWGARRLDLDLIAYGDRVIRQSDLRVPHPRMSFRPFVLAPAAEVAPAWRHPELGADLSRLLRVCREGAAVVRLIGGEESGVLSHAAISQLVLLELPKGIACGVGGLGVGDGIADTPRLTIDLRENAETPLGPRGPRLTLADCPREHWRAEVRAAIRCVWPRESSGVS